MYHIKTCEFYQVNSVVVCFVHLLFSKVNNFDPLVLPLKILLMHPPLLTSFSQIDQEPSAQHKVSFVWPHILAIENSCNKILHFDYFTVHIEVEKTTLLCYVMQLELSFI